MAELARGAVTDRPWGRTLGALATRGLTGQLTITTDGKPYRVAFTQGAVVGASSPLASDSAVRVALTGGLISSTQVGDITRRLAAAASRDEVDVIAESTKLAADQMQRLRRRVVAQRAARTFSLDQGEFVIDDQITVPVVAGAELDVRAVVYLGARNNLSEDRLGSEIDQLGGWFQIKPDAIADLAQYGFTETEKPVLKGMLEGNNLEELERAFIEIGPRGVRAIVYALASCGACEMGAARPIPGRVTRESVHPRTRTPSTATERVTGSHPIVTTTGPTRITGQMPVVTTTRITGQVPVLTPDNASGVTIRPPSTPPSARTSTPVISRTQSWNTPTTVPRTATPTAAPINTPSARTPTNVPASRTQTPVPSRTQTPSWNTPTTVPRTQTPTNLPRTPTPQTQPPASRAPSTPPLSRTQTGPRDKPPSSPPGGFTPTPGTDDATRLRSPSSSPRPPSPGPTRARRNTAATIETEALIRDRTALVDRDADHFTLLGITRDASPEAIRGAYFTLARKLHPDRLASLGIVDGARDAQRLFAQINLAFAVLNDAVRRADYLSVLSRGGESAVRAEDARADEIAMRVMHAEEAFRRGEMALRRDLIEQALVEFTTAIEMQPNEPEYQAMFVWSKFAAATDKQAIAAQTRQQLTRAAQASTTSPTARFFLGRVERILGREREALAHFYEVLAMKPNHTDASSEVRVLESRLKVKR